MKSEFALSLFFLVSVFAKIENDFIVDYFRYRKLHCVVGYSCNNPKDDLSLIKSFNQIGITASTSKLEYGLRINRFANTDYWKIGVFLDLRCLTAENISSIFSEASDYRMYDELHYWLVLGSSVGDVTSIVDDTAFGLSTDFVIAVPATVILASEGYELYDTYNIWKERGAKLNVTFLGTWSKNGRINVTLKQEKFSRRANMHGLIIKTSFFASKYKPPQMTLEDYLQDYATLSKDGLSKFGYMVVLHLSEMYNFTLKCGEVETWQIGDVTGPIIRALLEKRIDLSGSPATMNVKRTYLVKYVHQSWPFRSCFIFRSPQPRNIKINEVLGPLEMEVWYLTAILCVLSLWILASVFRYENNESTFMRYSDSFLVICGAICQQSTELKMNQLSTRIAFLFVMIFSFLLYNYYSASIVSVRLSEPIYRINDSLAELAKLDLKLASEWMVYFDFFIKKQDWDTKTFYTKSWINVPEADRFMEPEKAMLLVQKGGFAYHTHPDVGYPFVNRYYDNHEICELTEVHLAQPTFSTFAVNFNSTFTEMIRIGITKISEVGIRKRQVLRWTSQKPRCRKDVLRASSLNIYEFAPHLLILMFGMGLALTIFIVENAMTGRYNTKVLRILRYVFGKGYY